MESVSRTPQYDAANMQKWLTTCVRSHSKCAEFQQRSTHGSQRPTRILRVWPGKLQLCCDIFEEEQYPYITLSHMWGTEPQLQLTLTRSKLADFQRKIAIASLPAIFQEAVRITQLLGFQYIWIDSLCIIQDDMLDWQLEASKMAMVYGNAICNLTCLFPPNIFTSQVHPEPRSYMPCVLCPATSRSDGIFASRLHAGSGISCDWHDRANWPVYSRAWTVGLTSLRQQKNVLTLRSK
jgi:hypothetical protein